MLSTVRITSTSIGVFWRHLALGLLGCGAAFTFLGNGTGTSGSVLGRGWSVGGIPALFSLGRVLKIGQFLVGINDMVLTFYQLPPTGDSISPRITLERHHAQPQSTRQISEVQSCPNSLIS